MNSRRTGLTGLLTPAAHLFLAFAPVAIPTSLQGQSRAQNLPSVSRIAPEVEFGRIISGSMGVDGRLCVLDDIEVKVRCFDREGRALWSYGRKGEGPGEWRSVYRLAIAPDLSVAVADLATATVHRISATGHYLGRARLPLSISQLTSVLLPGKDTLVVSATIFQGGRAVESGVHVLAQGDTIARVRSFGALPDSRDEQKLLMFGAGGVTLTSRGTLLYSRRYPNVIMEYSMQGRLLREIASPYLTRGPDDEFDIVQEGDRRKISSVVLAPGTSVVGPAREGTTGNWWLVRTDAGGRQFLDEVNPTSRKWALPVPLPTWPARISVVGRDERSGLYVGYTTCDEEPCLVRFSMTASKAQ